MSEGAEPLLSLRGLTKAFGDTQVLKGLDLDVYPGEFMTLLGPSGCGKTTTLRIIAGLEAPDQGEVLLRSADISRLPPEKRNVNTVFQSYALFPHMTVAGNIGYGLRMRGMKKPQIAQKVDEMLSLIQLEGFGKRMPQQLSGGQRQRVAIARAAALAPELLLLDEPLGALDMKLRKQMQVELKRMQKQLGIAFIYITHDQEEALNMSDRVAVMREGRFEQIGTPQALYENPETLFCASFVGQSNLLRGVVTAVNADGRMLAECEGVTIPCYSERHFSLGDPICVCVRAERMHMSAAAGEGTFFSGTLRESQYAGGVRRAAVTLSTGRDVTLLRQTEDEEEALEPGMRVFVGWNERKAAVVPDTGEALA